MTTDATWFDAHLDLGLLAETGRDMHVAPAESRGRFAPAAVTLPELRRAGVRTCLATVFTQPVPDPGAPDAETGPFAYDPEDGAAGYVAGMRQLKLYRAWADAGLIELMPVRGPGWNAEPAERGDGDGPVRVGVLMEGADPIESPDDLGLWVDQGVVAVGLAWREGTRYAGGDAPGAHRGGGLTAVGRAFVSAMDDARVVHDLSHLSERAVDDLLDATDAPVIISHANCRSLLGGQTARHPTDDVIAEVGRRGGVMGVTLLSRFLAHPWAPGDRAPVEAVCDHIEHICQIHGHRRAVGLGSDTDGGVTALELPAGMTTIADLGLLVGALRDRGWSAEEVAGFAHANWDRYWAGGS